jgi:hypothetical protein
MATTELLLGRLADMDRNDRAVAKQIDALRRQVALCRRMILALVLATTVIAWSLSASHVTAWYAAHAADYALDRDGAGSAPARGR